MAKRLQAMGQPNYKDGFAVRMHQQVLELPLTWKRPRTIFVNSMSDLFHKNVPLEFVERVFDVMGQASWHRFQILTKRSDRLAKVSSGLKWSPNIWMGVSVENDRYLYRADHLRSTPAAVRFLSLEPLLGPVPDMDLKGIDWVIVGGESGPGARPMKAEWVVDIRDQCRNAIVPFFFKQWGGMNKKRAGRKLDGRTWDQVPKMQRTRIVV